MIKILHCADLHIGMENYGRVDPATGVNGRVRDFLLRLDEAIKYGLQHEMDLFLFCGDAFRTRTPPPTYLRAFASRLMRLAANDVPIVLVPGNHDLPVRVQRASALDLFDVLSVPRLIVGRTEATHIITTKSGPVQVATVPYPVRQRLLRHAEYQGGDVAAVDQAVQQIITANVAALASQLEADMPAVLAGHFSVSGAVFGAERSVMIGHEAVVLRSALADPAWDYVALGHIHKHQSLNDDRQPPIVYSGSMERIDFGEEGQPKGFCWVEVERGHADWKFVALGVREFKTIRVDVRECDNPMTEVREKVAKTGDLGETVVRLIVHHHESQRKQLPDAALRMLLADAYHIANINREVERDVRVRLAGMNLETLDDAELLQKYLEIADVDPERAAALMKLAREVFQEVADA